MRRIILFSIAAAGIIVAAILFTVSTEVRAIQSIKMEIYDVRVEHMLPDIAITLSARIVNEENSRVRGLSGNFTVLVSNVSVGTMGFDTIDIGAHAQTTIDIPLTISYSQMAEGLIEAIASLQFSLTITGTITGDILFGLMSYRQPVEAHWYP